MEQSPATNHPMPYLAIKVLLSVMLRFHRNITPKTLERRGAFSARPAPGHPPAKGESTVGDWPGLGGKHFFQLFAYA